MNIGTANIYVWKIDPEEIEAYFQQGWRLSHIRRGHWGKSFLLKHREV